VGLICGLEHCRGQDATARVMERRNGRQIGDGGRRSGGPKEHGLPWFRRQFLVIE
jgi:hypothetical protein